MLKLGDHLALARLKLIRSRKEGLSFDPSKLPKITSLVKTAEWKKEEFQGFCKKVRQANIVIFTVLPGIDEPEVPDTLILASLWGEVLVAQVKEMVEGTTETEILLSCKNSSCRRTRPM